MKLTLKEQNFKITVISLKSFVLKDFNDPSLHVRDIPDYVKGILKDKAAKVMINPKTNKNYDNWVDRLHDFVENEI